MVALLALAAPALGRRLASPQNDVPNDYDGFIWIWPVFRALARIL